MTGPAVVSANSPVAGSGSEAEKSPVPARRSLLADALSVTGLSVLARLAGAMKTVVAAAWFPPGPELDAFLLAFLIPSLLGDILAGAIGMALVPALSEGSVESRNSVYAEALHRSFRLLASLGLILAAGVWVLSTIPATIPSAILAPGVPQWRMAGPLLLVMLPMLPLMGIAAVWRSVLHTRLHFRAAAIAPVLTPVLTVALLPFAPRLGALTLAIGTTLGMLAEAAVLALVLSRRGVALFPRRSTSAHWTPGGALRQYAAVVAGNVMMRGSAAVDQAAAALLGAGALSLLNYGTRLSAVLLAIGPASLGTILFPRFATVVAGRSTSALIRIMRISLAAGCTLALAAVAILAIGSDWLTRVFLVRGAFTLADARQVALVQTFSMLQFPFAVALAILSGVAAALRINHAILPVWGVALALHCVLDFIVFTPLGVRGIALSTAVIQGLLVVAHAWLIARAVKRMDSASDPI